MWSCQKAGSSVSLWLGLLSRPGFSPDVLEHFWAGSAASGDSRSLLKKATGEQVGCWLAHPHNIKQFRRATNSMSCECGNGWHALWDKRGDDCMLWLANVVGFISPLSSSIQLWTVSGGWVSLMCFKASSSSTSPVGESDLHITLANKRKGHIFELA